MNSDAEAQIRDCEARLCAAMQASDVAELDALIADDLLFAGPNGDLATKAMDLDLHRTGATRFTELVPQDLEIRVWSDRFVLVFARVSVAGTFLGDAFAGDYRYTRIWRRGEQGWQIAGGSVTLMQ
nr:nuclear transport factor 2 family protein [Nodosilinea sp. TSF1-S3]